MSPLTFFNVFRTQYCHLWWRTLDRGHLLLLWWFPTKSNFLNLKFSVRHLYTSKGAGSTELCFPKHFVYFYIGSSLKATFYLVAVVDFKRGCFCRKVVFFFFFLIKHEVILTSYFHSWVPSAGGLWCVSYVLTLLSIFDLFIFHDTSECLLVSRTLFLRSNCGVISTKAHYRDP